MPLNSSLKSTRDFYEKNQKEKIAKLRRMENMTLKNWFEAITAECHKTTIFFYQIYGSLYQTMQDHPEYKHLKGATINRGLYYITGNPVYLINMISYVLYEFFLPQHLISEKTNANNIGITRAFDKEKIPFKYFDKFFKLCLQRHQEAENIYGNLDDFTEMHPRFEHLEDGWLRNRTEYQQMPNTQALLDLGNYTIYELRKPIHKII